MQKLIVFSDVHGNERIFDYLDKQYPDEVKICLGDCQLDQLFIEEHMDDYIFVRGNSDIHFRSKMNELHTYKGITILNRSSDNIVPTEIMIECENMKILVCHGHLIVKEIEDHRKEKGADLVLVGHTHHFDIQLDKKDIVRVINPGCSNAHKVRDIDANWNRKRPSYVELVLDNGKILEVEKMEFPKELD